jgi:hypothetical protein
LVPRPRAHVRGLDPNCVSPTRHGACVGSVGASTRSHSILVPTPRAHTSEVSTQNVRLTRHLARAGSQGPCGAVDKGSLYFGPHAEGTRQRSLPKMCAPDSEPCLCGFSGPCGDLERVRCTLVPTPRALAPKCSHLYLVLRVLRAPVGPSRRCPPPRAHTSDVSTQNVRAWLGTVLVWVLSACVGTSRGSAVPWPSHRRGHMSEVWTQNVRTRCVHARWWAPSCLVTSIRGHCVFGALTRGAHVECLNAKCLHPVRAGPIVGPQLPGGPS